MAGVAPDRPKFVPRPVPPTPPRYHTLMRTKEQQWQLEQQQQLRRRRSKDLLVPLPNGRRRENPYESLDDAEWQDPVYEYIQ